MNAKRSSPQSGSALLIVLIALMILLAIAGAIVSVMIADAKAIGDFGERMRAFYLAESSLQSAEFELIEYEDPQNDGFGNRSSNLSTGTYTVTATDLGDDYFQLVGTGVCGGTSVTLSEIIRLNYSSRFPGGAISVMGSMASTQVQLGAGSNLLIDGGNSPGISFSDSSTYTTAGGQFASGVCLGYIQETDVVGSVTNTFNPGNANLSIQSLAPADVGISITSGMYTDFRNQVATVFLPSASNQTLPGTGNATYGASTSPVNYKFPPDQKLTAGQSLTGYGTLVFSRNLVVEGGASIDWNGDIIINADDAFDGLLDIDGSINVTGNILVVGGTGRNLQMLVKPGGQVTVNGAMTLLADYSSASSKISLEIENDLNVNGLLTSVAPKQDLQFKTGSNVHVTGSMQIGRLDDTQTGTELRMNFEEQAAIVKDDVGIAAGAKALVELGDSIGTPSLSSILIKPNLTRKFWKQIPEL